MSNSPTTSVPDDIDKALDNLIDWIMGHDNEELANIDLRKAKREVLTTVESYGDRRELEGHLEEVRSIKSGFDEYRHNGFEMNQTIDELVDQMAERIAHLKKELEALK